MNDDLDRAISALRAGDRAEARRLLAAVLRQDKDNLRAWQWMYNAAENDKERKHCLEQILRLNPGNQKAAQMLAQLSGYVNFETEKTAKLTDKSIHFETQNKKNPQNKILLLGLVILALVCCCFIMVITYESDNSIVSTNNEVKYVISGNAKSALVSYMNEQGGTEQVETNLPFEKKWIAQKASSLSLVAQNNGSGSITCEIWYRGEKIKTSTSTAQYGVVTCADFIIP